MRLCWVATGVALLLAVMLGTSVPAYAAADDIRMAYLIGFGRYQSGLSKGTFRDLPIVNDIEAMGNALLRIGFATEDVVILTDGDQPIGSSLTYRKPLTSLESLDTPVALSHFTRAISDALLGLENRNARGLIVFYFSGHGGMIVPESGKEKDGERVLAFPNSHSDDPDSFARVYELLEKLAQRAPDVQKVLIIDACANQLKAKPTTRTQSRSAEALPVHFFSSRLGKPSFFNPETQSSLFTSVLADALVHADDLGEEGNLDGFVDTEEVVKYVERHFPTKSAQLKRPMDGESKSVAQKPWMLATEKLVLGQLGRAAPMGLNGSYSSRYP